jgi:hypothetical protein
LGRAIVQIIGDEALYGRDYIVEPSYNRTETPNPGYTGNKTVVDKSIIIQTPLCMWIIGPLLHISFSSIFSLYFALALGLLSHLLCSMDAASLL